MARETITVGQPNINIAIAEFIEFGIRADFKDWSSAPNPNYYATKISLRLEKKTTNNYYNIFYTNFCEDNLEFEIHISKVYTKEDEKLDEVYISQKPRKHFSLEPNNPNAKVQVDILLYDVDLRCPGDKLLYLCKKEGFPYDKHPLKDINCTPTPKVESFDGIDTQPDVKKGSILVGG